MQAYLYRVTVNAFIKYCFIIHVYICRYFQPYTLKPIIHHNITSGYTGIVYQDVKKPQNNITAEQVKFI